MALVQYQSAASVRFIRMGLSNRFRVVALLGGRELGEVVEIIPDGTWTAIKRGHPDLIVPGWVSRRAAAEFLAAGAWRRRP